MQRKRTCVQILLNCHVFCLRMQECQCIDFALSVSMHGLVFLSDNLKDRGEKRCLDAFRQCSYAPLIHLPAFTFWYFWLNVSRETYIVFVVTFKDIFYQALFVTSENVRNTTLPAQM